MKKHQFLIAILFLLVNLNLFAQQEGNISNGISYSVGKPYKIVNRGKSWTFQIGSSVMKIKKSSETYVFQRFSLQEMKLEKQARMNLDIWKNDVEDILFFGNKLYVFYTRYIRKKKLEQLFYQEIDIESCALSGVERKLIEVNYKLAGNLTGFLVYKTTNKYKFTMSYEEINY